MGEEAWGCRHEAVLRGPRGRGRPGWSQGAFTAATAHCILQRHDRSSTAKDCGVARGTGSSGRWAQGLDQRVGEGTATGGPVPPWLLSAPGGQARLSH